MEINKTINKLVRDKADEINALITNNKPVYNLTSCVLPLAHIRIIYDLGYENAKVEYIDIKKCFESKKE